MSSRRHSPCRTNRREAFRTISEVAIELDVPQHVLRFWESRFAQIKPVKRAGGRRYYRPEDVDLLRGIRALLYVRRPHHPRRAENAERARLAPCRRRSAGEANPRAFARAADKHGREASREAKKSNGHLRAVPSPMSLPFFDASEKSNPIGATAPVTRHAAAGRQERVQAQGAAVRAGRAEKGAP